MSTPAVIFDIDGTLADITHRLHHIQNGKNDWDSFHAECVNDKIVTPIRDLAVALDNSCDYKVIIVSGRTDKVRNETEEWLRKHRVPFDLLMMRKEGDFRKDSIIKEEILDELLKQDHKIAWVIDDRPSVVEMWRRRGLTCLQCREWRDDLPTPGVLTLMIGPSGAGKSSWISRGEGWNMGIWPNRVVSSDSMREQICGDFRDQSKNQQVFAALHSIVKARLENGLPTVVDATNLHRADRMAIINLVPNLPKIRYIVLDRPMEEKIRDGGWRLEIPGLLEKHQERFNSALEYILRGDDLPNIEVHDLRRV